MTDVTDLYIELIEKHCGVSIAHAVRDQREALKSVKEELLLFKKPCLAVIHHGPGHQSKTSCGIKGLHEVHRAAPMGEVLEWREDEGWTDYFDQAHIDY